MSKPIAVAWRESAADLYARSRAARDVAARKRLGALWLVRRGLGGCRRAGAAERGGLTAALVGAGVAGGDGAYCADELRLGPRGQRRRVLAPQGAKVARPGRLQCAWCSLLPAVDPRAGARKWRWSARVNAAPL